MNYLIDTHILLWSLFEPERLNKKIRETLINPQNIIYVSKISLWEISLKYSLNKLKLNKIKVEDLENEIEKSNFEIIELKTDDILSYYKLPNRLEHKDPFDRMLIWQSIRNKFTFISRDSRVKEYKKFGLKYLY